MKEVETIPELLAWDKAGKLTDEMISRQIPAEESAVKTLDAQDGVYVVTYRGGELNFGLGGGESDKDYVVYVGVSKFNSSRHFISGNTGTSTLRRSLGALLAHKLELVPVPRSKDEDDADRYNNYAFNEGSEDRLTAWMRENFKLSYLKLAPDEVDAVYRGLIAYSAPLFNFQHNPDSKYGAQIKAARRQCTEQAMQSDSF